MKWISIKKRLPDASNDYLAILTKDQEIIIGRYTKVGIGFKNHKSINENMWLTDMHYSGLLNEITHWSILPKLPKEEDKQC